MKGLSCLLLGGGKSSRMGLPKGLLDDDGTPWLESQLKNLAQCGLGQVVVVLGEDHSQYEAQLPYLKTAFGDWIEFQGMNLRVQHNLKTDLGAFASLQCGLSPLNQSQPLRPCFVLPIDVPCPTSQVWKSLKDSLNNTQAQVVVPTFQNQGGHPVLLCPQFWKKLASVPPDSPEGRLDVQIRRLPPRLVMGLPVLEEVVVMNLNTPELWQEYCERDIPLRPAEKIGKSK